MHFCRRVIPCPRDVSSASFPSVCLTTQRIRIPNPRFVRRASFALRLSDNNKVVTTCMLYHAARVSKRALLTRTSSPEPANVWPSSTFTAVLQAAAARAWSRTAVRRLRTVSASASVTLGEESTSRTREPLPGVPSDIDSGSRSVRWVSA